MVTKDEAAYPVMKYNCNVNVQPDLETWNLQTFVQNGNYLVEHYIDSDKEGLSKDSTFRINVPAPQLETWTTIGHRIASNNTYTIQNLMADPNKPGISKESQFVVDVDQNELTTLTNQTINNTGHFEFLPPNGYDGLSLVSGTVDMTSKILQNLNWEPTGLPSTFKISDFNQANSTDYIGVKEITCLDTNIQPVSNVINITRLIFTGGNQLMNVLISDSSKYKRKSVASHSFSLPAGTGMISFREYSNYYQMRVYLANISNSLSVSTNGSSTNPTYYWYYDTSTSVTSIDLYSPNGAVFHFVRNDASQYVSSCTHLYKTYFNITFE